MAARLIFSWILRHVTNFRKLCITFIVTLLLTLLISHYNGKLIRISHFTNAINDIYRSSADSYNSDHVATMEVHSQVPVMNIITQDNGFIADSKIKNIIDEILIRDDKDKDERKHNDAEDYNKPQGETVGRNVIDRPKADIERHGGISTPVNQPMDNIDKSSDIHKSGQPPDKPRYTSQPVNRTEDKSTVNTILNNQAGQNKDKTLENVVPTSQNQDKIRDDNVTSLTKEKIKENVVPTSQTKDKIKEIVPTSQAKDKVTGNAVPTSQTSGKVIQSAEATRKDTKVDVKSSDVKNNAIKKDNVDNAKDENNAKTEKPKANEDGKKAGPILEKNQVIQDNNGIVNQGDKTPIFKIVPFAGNIVKSKKDATAATKDDVKVTDNTKTITPNTTGNSVTIKPLGTIHDFPYIINNKSICDGANLTYVIYVHTSPDHFDRRNSMRNTWAKNSVIPKYESRTIFMVGNASSKRVQKKLYEESRMYGDIVQEDYVDSYRNLTQKAVGALKWISTYCDKVKFVIKTDDDIFLDIFRLLKLMKDKYWDAKRYVMGLLWYDNSMPILRDPKTCAKWCVSYSDFKGKFYPRYLSGGFLFISGDIVREMYEASKRTPFFWVDDVYLTGLLPKKMPDVTYIDIAKYYKYSQKHFNEAQFNKTNPKKYLGTLTNSKEPLWLKTLQQLSREDQQLLGGKYSDLLHDAEELVAPS